MSYQILTFQAPDQYLSRKFICIKTSGPSQSLSQLPKSFMPSFLFTENLIILPRDQMRLHPIWIYQQCPGALAYASHLIHPGLVTPHENMYHG